MVNFLQIRGTGNNTVIIDHTLASISERILMQRISDKDISSVLQLRKESLTKVPRTAIKAVGNIPFSIS